MTDAKKCGLVHEGRLLSGDHQGAQFFVTHFLVADLPSGTSGFLGLEKSFEGLNNDRVPAGWVINSKLRPRNHSGFRVERLHIPAKK